MSNEKALTHLSLFTGVGELDLSAELAGFQTVGQCEFAPYPTRVLERHWPGVARWKDVREFTAESFYKRTECQTVTVLSGGFPCQPHSLAGKRLASLDERDLWPEYRRVIGEIKPSWVVAENVRGLLSSEFGGFYRGILRDLSDMGYRIGWCTYPAAWVGAVHRRERVFTVAHAAGVGLEISDALQSRFAAAIERTSGQYDLAAATMGIQRFGDCGNIRARDVVPHWMDRIKAIGNAVAPLQALPIFEAIAAIEQYI